jgi:hypothetical protein
VSVVILCEIQKDAVREDRVLELCVACCMFQDHESDARLGGFGRRETLGIGGVFCRSCKCVERSLGPGRGMKHTLHIVCSEQCIHVYIHEAARMDIQLQFVGYLKKGKLLLAIFILTAHLTYSFVPTASVL